jgi:spore coat protein JC
MLHVDCIADALRRAQEHLDSKNFYACNPSFDKGCGRMKNS